MGIGEENLQVVIDVDVILESCPITILILNLLVYNSTIQYSNIAIIVVYDGNKCHRTISHYIMSCSSSVIHRNVMIL